MKIEIKEEKANPLFYRKEISLVLKDFEGTPKKENVVKEIAKELSTKEELISIDTIKQRYGKNEAVCYAEIYETVEHKERYKPTKAENKAEEKPKEPEKKSEPREKAEEKEEKKVEETKEEKAEKKEAE